MGSKLQQFKDQWVSGVDAVSLAGRCWDIEIQGSNVRFGSLADMCVAKSDVRFTPQSGHVHCDRLCLLWANSGHQASKTGSQAASEAEENNPRPKRATRSTSAAATWIGIINLIDVLFHSVFDSFVAITYALLLVIRLFCRLLLFVHLDLLAVCALV